jgi:hypothetical protein
MTQQRDLTLQRASTGTTADATYEYKLFAKGHHVKTKFAQSAYALGIVHEHHDGTLSLNLIELKHLRPSEFEGDDAFVVFVSEPKLILQS